MAAPGSSRSLPILTLLCTAVVGQDIVFQQRPAFGEPRSGRAPVDSLEFPADVAGSEVRLLRFGGSFNCRAPDGQLGRCGPLLDCDVMRDALLPLTTLRLRFLKKSICRFVAGKPLVCCPSKRPQLVPTTSAPFVFEVERRPTEPPLTPPPQPAPVTNPEAPSPVTNPEAPSPVTNPEAPSPVTNPQASSPVTNPEAPSPVTNPQASSPVTNPPAPSPAATDFQTGPSQAPPAATSAGSPSTPQPGLITSPDPEPASVTTPETGAAPTEPIAAASPEVGTTEGVVPVPTAVEEAEPAAERTGPVPPPGLDVCGHKLVQRITGGQESLPNSWPWLAAFGYELKPGKMDFLCGGALITDRHVLTAAHCVRKELKVIRLGDHDLTNDTEVNTVTEHGVEQMWPHEEYDNRTLFNDIAIVKLSSKVNFNEAVHPICLPLIPEMRNINMVRKITFIAGWGTTSFKGDASPVLREAKVRVHRHQLCRQRYRALRHKLSEKQMCASAREGGVNQDTCQGDSGGPMMMSGVLTPNWYVMGVVSFGFRCGEPRFPGVYTRVTDYVDWVVENLR